MKATVASPFAATVLPLAKVLGVGSLLSAGGLTAWAANRHPRTPTHEDWSCGTYTTGAIGSGKITGRLCSTIVP